MSFENPWMLLGALAGAIPVAIHLINLLQKWYPGSIEIPLRFRFPQVLNTFPALKTVPGGSMLARLYIYPSVIAFTFFLASDVSLSLGLAKVMVVAVGAVLLAWGVDLSSNYMTGGFFPWQRFGSVSPGGDAGLAHLRLRHRCVCEPAY